MIHVDVMDGHFVPDISVGQPVVESLRKATDLELDVHLMTERPERFIEDFARAGADRIAIHAEATSDLHRALERIRKAGAKAGLALQPGTPVESAFELLEEIDFLLVLTADAGLIEGEYIEGSSERILLAAEERDETELDFEIAADGGIGQAEVQELTQAGADILVAGAAIFDKGDARTNLESLMRATALESSG